MKGMKREIVKYGAKVLTEKASPVTEFDAALEQLVADMFETMYDAPGVGLAAPQVGVSRRLFVMDCSKEKPAVCLHQPGNPPDRRHSGGG